LEAFDLCRRLQPDLLILDPDLPRLSGLAVIRRLASDRYRPRMLIVSAHADIGSVQAALEIGADGYVLTTVGAAELLDAVQRVLRGERVLLGVEGLLKEVTEPLGPQELVVLQQAAKGMSNQEIANYLAISPRTVGSHLTHIFTKLGVNNRTGAVERGRQLGLFLIE
jgi:DNA-binding NarL/FixJ family response regulator